jgi:hypothetical protein
MAANPITMGFEGLIYYGAPGSTASTQLLNTRDVKISCDPEMGNTTIRGDGSAPPVDTESVTAVKWSMSLNMLQASTDTAVAALLTAAHAPAAVAIRMKSFATGKGADIDCNVKAEQGIPLKGEQTVDFTFTPNRALRDPNGKLLV